MPTLATVTYAAEHGTGADDTARLVEALSRVGVVLGPPTMSIRSVLDTFDARLARSGLRCESRAVRPSGPFEMVVLDRSGPDARSIVGSLVPSLADLSGPLRDRLTAVIATRTLEARLTLVGHVRRGLLHDADGNTVATVALFDAGTAAPGSLRSSRSTRRTTPVAVEVAMLMPRRSLTSHVTAALGELALQPIEVDVVEHAMQLCGIPPSGLDTTPSIPMAGDLGAPEGVRRLLTHLTGVLDATWAGTAEERDVEYLHEFRIAARRSRTVLRSFRDLAPDELVETGGSLFRVLSDLTGPPRDLDVMVTQWPELTAPLRVERREALEPLRLRLVEQRAEAHRRLTAGLRAGATRRAVDDWTSQLTGPMVDSTARTIADEHARRVRRAHRRVVRHGRAIEGDSPAGELHELRKDAKKLRYLIECFGDLLDAKPRKRFVAQLKRLQDNLGEFQDSDVQVRMLVDAAAELQTEGASLDTLLAVGHLVAVIEERGAAARMAFAHRFATFDTDDVRSAFDAMFFDRRS